MAWTAFNSSLCAVSAARQTITFFDIRSDDFSDSNKNIVSVADRRQHRCSYEWSFAIERKLLGAFAGDNFSSFAYKYALPTDYLRVITQLNSTDYSDVEDSWRVEGKYLLSDLSPNYIKYIKTVLEAVDLPPLFVEPFYLRLATKMASKLTQDKTLKKDLLREFSASMLSAMAIIGANDRESNPVPTMWSA